MVLVNQQEELQQSQIFPNLFLFWNGCLEIILITKTHETWSESVVLIYLSRGNVKVSYYSHFTSLLCAQWIKILYIPDFLLTCAWNRNIPLTKNIDKSIWTLFTSGVYEVTCSNASIAVFLMCSLYCLLWTVDQISLSIISVSFCETFFKHEYQNWGPPHTRYAPGIFSPPQCYRPELKGFKVSIIGLPGKRMSSKVLCTSTWRGFSTLKFSSICRSRCVLMWGSHGIWWKESVNVCVAHVDEEDLHLSFGYSSS